MGDERIYLSVTELAERMKWIWLETGWGGAGETFKTSLLVSSRKADIQSTTAWLITGVQSNHVTLNETTGLALADTDTSVKDDSLARVHKSQMD